MKADTTFVLVLAAVGPLSVLATNLRRGNEHPKEPVSVQKWSRPLPMTPNPLSFTGGRTLEAECPNYCNDEDIRDKDVADACSTAGGSFEYLADGYLFQAAREACSDNKADCTSWYECILEYSCANPMDVCNNENDREAMAAEACSAYQENEYWGTDILSLDTLKEAHISKPGEACKNIDACNEWFSCVTIENCKHPVDICSDSDDREVYIADMCSVYGENFEFVKEALKAQYSSTQELIPQGKACNDKMSTCQEWQNCLVDWTCANPCGAGAAGAVGRDGDEKYCWYPKRMRRCKQMCNKINVAMGPKNVKKRESCMEKCDSKKLCGT